MVASAISSQKSLRPALRSRRTFRCAPTVTPIRARAKWVRGWSPATEASSNSARADGPSNTPARIWPLTLGSRSRCATQPNEMPATRIAASVRSGSAPGM